MGNFLNQFDHEISLTHTYFDLRSKEYYDLSNLFVEVYKYDQTSDVDNCDPNNGDPIKLIDGSCTHAIFNLTQLIKCSYLSFHSSGTCQEVQELQLSLMVMLGSCNLAKIH